MSSVPEKLEQLHEKIKTLTVSTNAFKDTIKDKIEKLKPKIKEIANRAKACSFNDQQASDKRKELEELLAQKDELFKSYIKKDDIEKEGYLKTEDGYLKTEVDDKIKAALADLEILIDQSKQSNDSIETLIGEIEEELKTVASEISQTKTEKKTSGDALDFLDDDQSLGGVLEKLEPGIKRAPPPEDNELKSDTPIITGGGKSRRTKKQKTLRKRKTIKKKKGTTKKASKPRSRKR